MKTVIRDLDIIPDYDLGSICSPEEMLLFDIETTGLSKETTQLYLIGCAYFAHGSWHIRQWLTENARDEAQVLESFLSFASGFRTVVTFNGERFDIPYINYKADYYMLEQDLTGLSAYDVYARIKTCRKLLKLKSLSQKSLEEYLGIARDDQLNGGLLIPVYYSYEKTGDPEEEALLLLHNFDDLQGMLKILPVLAFADLLQGQFCFSSCKEQEDALTLSFRTGRKIPKRITDQVLLPGAKDGSLKAVTLEMEESDFQMTLPVFEGVGLLPLANVSDYYYLIEEDRVIHKDVAQFVPRSRRVKATRKNCFLKKQGRFVPVLSAVKEDVFSMAEDPKGMYLDLQELLSPPDGQIFQQIAQDILSFLYQ